ncbi:hypothetical protein ScalyP_jg9385 [Parmales sp. scaly parma]|nr:hypothetical protein ScalyP_jg9385 [Parmales sp. scaly parma]|tara:strand:- start:925 stop:1971 length:1047 start_codon:yes stop_codon:yes gene_type:complete
MGLFSKKTLLDANGSEIEATTIPLSLRQSWSLHLGFEPSEKKSILRRTREKVHIITNIDRDDLLEDRTFALFFQRLESILHVRLHPPKYYKMTYLIPNAPLSICVNVHNHEQMMTAYDKFGKLTKKKFANLKIRITPQTPNAEMYRTDKPKTVQQKLDNRNAINRYLADQFTKGRVDLETFSHIMGSKLVDAKAELYAIVPDGEREFHNYLIVQKERKKNVSPEDMYDKGKITIEEFEDLKFPDLKIKREKLTASWPKVEKLDVCVICDSADSANIQCLECNHKACSSCVYREFTTHPERRPFLLMHHIFCCQNGFPVRSYLPPKNATIGAITKHPDPNLNLIRKLEI